MSEPLELHFQEGFFGQTVEISVDGKNIARLVLRTRLQTGLAHMETLDLPAGTEVTINIPELNQSALISLDNSQRYVTINLVDEKLVIGSTDRLLGYL